VLLLLAMPLPSLAQTATSSESNASTRLSTIANEAFLWLRGSAGPTSEPSLPDTLETVTVPRVHLDALLWDNHRLRTEAVADSILFRTRLDTMARRIAAAESRPDAECKGGFLPAEVWFGGGMLVGAFLMAEIASRYYD